MHLESLFSPRSIAIIGASTKAGSVGWTLTENLLKNGYNGKVYPVNPKVTTLFDLPCYASVSAISDEIDLTIIIVPAAIVPAVLREAGIKGIKASVIISSGFKETGEVGQRLEEEIAAVAREYDIALLGPNCLGFLRPSIGLNASFAKQMPLSGEIAFFSQSGALCTALLDLTAEEGLGFSYFASVGNKAIIGENELLQSFAQDEQTTILSFYTEGITDSRTFIETGRALINRSQPKPVIALKSGTTPAGTKASGSHTGALAGSDAAYQSLFRQARMIRAEKLEDLIHLLRVFSHNPLPRGGRLSIITNAGGLGVLATDAAILHGLEMAKLSSETEEKLRSALPLAASVHNPVDVLGDALSDRYHAAIEAVAADDATDMLLVIVTPQTMTEAKKTAEAIADAKKRFEKPIVAVFSGKDSLEEGLAILRRNAVATVPFPEAGAEALAALAQITKWRKDFSVTPFSFDDINRDAVIDIFSRAKDAGRTTLYETEAASVCRAYGFPFLENHFVQSEAEALLAARSIGKPVALKIVSPDIIHKSDAGGVLLGIDPEQADQGYATLMTQVKNSMPEARLEGALVVEMAETGGQEIILGIKKEPGLGSLIMVGLGGIYVETFKDVAFRFSPMTQEDATEMIQELKNFPILGGTRGQTGIDIAALTSYIGRLSRLASDFPEIEELDINPLLVFTDAHSFRVLDARIRLKDSTTV